MLKAITEKPFEPLATTDIRLLTLKTAFLVAVTTARRASELCALRVDSPYLIFHKDKVTLHPDPSFMPKVITDFHINQDIYLPSFFQSPSTELEKTLHTLDIRQAVAFYKDRTSNFRCTPRLFVCYGGAQKGLPVSTQRFASWVVSTNRTCLPNASLGTD